MIEMTRAILVAVVLSCFVVGNAAAGFKSGNELFNSCESGENPKTAVEYLDGAECRGYVVGIADALLAKCLPSRVTEGQLVAVVLLWLRNHPEVRHYAANSLVFEALKENFHCN